MTKLWNRFDRWRSKMIFRIGTWWCEPEEVHHPVDQYAPPARKKPKLIKRK